MNFFRSIVGESEKPRAARAPVPQLSYSALRIHESEDDEDDRQEFEEITMEDVEKVNVLEQRQDEDAVPSQTEPRDENVEEDDERNVQQHAYEKGPPLDKETWASFSDRDGRIVNELKLRKWIFRGGVDESIRREVWSFLFGLYPLSSTFREREVISADFHVRYQALKKRWQTMLHLVSSAEATPLPPDYMCREVESPVVGGSTEQERNGADNECAGGCIEAAGIGEEAKHVVARISVDDGNKFEQFSFAELQAQFYAARQPIDLENLHKAVKLIDKDVPRTDRDQPIFKLRENLGVLRNILITFAAFHPDVGYVQGMNDIAGRFLSVFKSEVETYWSLDRYVDTIKDDFLQETMLAKISLVGKLLEEMDPELCHFLHSVDLGHLVFCHRWLILCFKREFRYAESLQLFEILSSCHLELTSLEAEQAREETRTKQVLREEGRRNERADQVEIHQEYTFDLFVCVAILKEHREDLMACSDQNQVFQCISGFTMKLDVETVLRRSQELFFLYCKKSVMDCFEQDCDENGPST